MVGEGELVVNRWLADRPVVHDFFNLLRTQAGARYFHLRAGIDASQSQLQQKLTVQSQEATWSPYIGNQTMQSKSIDVDTVGTEGAVRLSWGVIHNTDDLVDSVILA